jgi:hypothetical protein
MEGHLVLGGQRSELADLAARIDVALVGEVPHPLQISLHLRRFGSRGALPGRKRAKGPHPRPVRTHGKRAVGRVEPKRNDVRLGLLDLGIAAISSSIVFGGFCGSSPAFSMIALLYQNPAGA